MLRQPREVFQRFINIGVQIVIFVLVKEKKNMAGLLDNSEIIRLVVIAVVLLVTLGVLRFLFKLTKTAFQMGCALILFVVGAIFVLTVLS